MADQSELALSADALVNLLHDLGVLTDAQFEEVATEQQRTGKTSREIVLGRGLMKEDDILEAMANYLGTRVVSLPTMDIPPSVFENVPAAICRKFNVVPVEANATAVTLATPELLSPETMDELMFVLTRDVSLVMARDEDVRTCINHYYGDDTGAMAEMLDALESEIQDVDSLNLNEGDDKELEAAASSRPVIRFVNLILYQAINDRASDIHFEPFEKEFRIRYRVDGALYEMSPPPRRLALPVISRVKVMSNLNIAERRLPQDGRIQLTIGGRPIDLRVSTLPTQFGESVVLRVLDRSVVSLDLENLGMPEDVYEAFCADINKPNGILVVTGPTGSGKTTTLYSGLRRINTVDMKILTAEEPVEYDIEGIVQVPVSEAIGNSFSRILRAFLRQDPDAMMIGEIRDIETAQIAIQASLTGHLVFSTLHTNDAAGAVTRLIDMGVEPYLISSTLQAVLAQRLVRTICSHCKTPYKPDDQILKSLNLKEQDVGEREFYYGTGCSHCNSTGYRGRKGVYEYLQVTLPIKDMINERKPTLIIREKAIELGMRPLRQDGIRNILDGYSTVDEILRYT